MHVPYILFWPCTEFGIVLGSSKRSKELSGRKMKHNHIYHQEWKKKSKLNCVEEEHEGEWLEKEVEFSQETPKEPMEFLSRSWSVSAEEISKALHHKHNHISSPSFFEHASHPEVDNHHSNEKHGHVIRGILDGIGKWFHFHHHHHHDHHDNHHHHHHEESNHKKDMARLESAHMHTLLSVAGLATALAAVTADADNSSKSNHAVASASELLASHYIEIAEHSGARGDHLASTVRSAVDVKCPGDLITMTAAAATALRAEATLRSRIMKEHPKRIASISPCDRDPHSMESLMSEKEHQKFECVGELLHLSNKGGLKLKQVSIYINKDAQVIIKLKNKHVGGAFSKKDKCLVYNVCNEINAWDLRKGEKENMDAYFRLKTGQGFLEFKCKTKEHKQQWVDGIQSMLHKVGYVSHVHNSLQRLCVK